MSGFLCDDCGRDVAVHAVLDSEDWVRIADDGAYCLCPQCINARAIARGMRIACELEFVGDGMRSVVTPRVAKAQGWRPRDYIRFEGAGLRALYRSS